LIQYLPVLGFLVNLAGVASYAKDTLAGRASPNRMTWLLWSVIPAVAAGAALSTGATWAVLPTASSAICTLIVFLASFWSKGSPWKIVPFDVVCGTMSVVAVVMWRATDDANVAVALSLVAEVFAVAPTMRKAWSDPSSETTTGYLCGAFSAATGLATGDWRFAVCGFPCYALAVCTVLVVVITLRGRLCAQKPANPRPQGKINGFFRFQA
jgi:hypothetical protein